LRFIGGDRRRPKSSGRNFLEVGVRSFRTHHRCHVPLVALLPAHRELACGGKGKIKRLRQRKCVGKVAFLQTQMATTKPRRHRQMKIDQARGQNIARSSRPSNRSLDDDNRRRTSQTHCLLRAQRITLAAEHVHACVRNGAGTFGLAVHSRTFASHVPNLWASSANRRR